MVGRPKPPTMFAIETSRSLDVCSIFDKNNSKRFTSSLRFEYKDRSVCGKESLDPSVPMVTKTDKRGGRAIELSLCCRTPNEPWE